MSALYLESSAVVAWLFNDVTAGEVIRVMNEAEIVVTSEGLAERQLRGARLAEGLMRRNCLAGRSTPR